MVLYLRAGALGGPASSLFKAGDYITGVLFWLLKRADDSNSGNPRCKCVAYGVTVSSSSYCYPRLMRVTVKRSGGWATVSFCSWNNSTAFKCSAGKQPKVIGFNISKVDSNHRLKVGVKYLSPFSSDHLTTKKKVFSFFLNLIFIVDTIRNVLIPPPMSAHLHPAPVPQNLLNLF